MHNASAPSVPGTASHAVRPPSREASIAPPGTVDSSQPRIRSDSVAPRATARLRPVVTVGHLDPPVGGVEATDEYVRRFWIPLLGPGAVADLLRLTAAARSGRPLKLPVHTSLLARHGLVRRVRQDRLAVAPLVPMLSPGHVRRLPPRIRRDHQARLRMATSR